MKTKTKFALIIEDILKFLLPIFFWGFLFAGALVKYNNVNSINYALVNIVFQPMRVNYIKCKEKHKELIYDRGQFNAACLISSQIIKRNHGEQIKENSLIDLVDDSTIFVSISKHLNKVNQLEREVEEFYSDL